MSPAAESRGSTIRVCTFYVAGGHYGLDAAIVREVLKVQATTPVPGANAAITGIINLRGEIVTSVDLRHRLGYPPAEDLDRAMSVVVTVHDTVTSLVVDAVGDVIELQRHRFEPVPPTVDEGARGLIAGVYALPDSLVHLLDIGHLLPEPAGVGRVVG